VIDRVVLEQGALRPLPHLTSSEMEGGRCDEYGRHAAEGGDIGWQLPTTVTVAMQRRPAQTLVSHHGPGSAGDDRRPAAASSMKVPRPGEPEIQSMARCADLMVDAGAMARPRPCRGRGLELDWLNGRRTAGFDFCKAPGTGYLHVVRDMAKASPTSST